MTILFMPTAEPNCQQLLKFEVEPHIACVVEGSDWKSSRNNKDPKVKRASKNIVEYNTCPVCAFPPPVAKAETRFNCLKVFA